MAKINKPFDDQKIVIESALSKISQTIQNTLVVAPTGAGKTIIIAFTAKGYLKRNPGKFVVVFAHRDVLLSQISMAMAQVGLAHNMICSTTTERMISNEHIDELGESYLDYNSRLIIASVPTWIKRDTTKLSSMAGLWFMDEAHHVLEENMWGQCVSEFGHCSGVGVTATPKRTDGKGLGRHVDGVFDDMILAPSMGDLILSGRLSAYKVYAAPDKVDMTGVNITSSGDYNQVKLAKATDNGDITGDAIKHYNKYAKGKQGIIFAASIGHAEHVASDFQKAGINAVALSSKTKEITRQKRIKEFRQGKIELLVNYDLFGEGFDVPAVSVVIMLRKTESYALFKQMFGRCLRVFKGKRFGILIDHVGNVERHCGHMQHVHDDPEWTLDRYSKGKASESVTVNLSRICPECRFFYYPTSNNPSAFICPGCGHCETNKQIINEKKQRLVHDGELVEYDTGWLSQIKQKIAHVDKPVEDFKNEMGNSAPRVVVHSAVKKHKERQREQFKLRPWLVNWCNETGINWDHDIQLVQSLFEKEFGIDVFRAQVLSKAEAEKLKLKVQEKTIEMILNIN